MTTEQGTHAWHDVGHLHCGDDGPERVELACSYTSTGRDAGQWMVDIEIWPHEDTIDPDDATRHDATTGEMLPESSWAMTPKQARELAALITRAVEHIELFEDAEDTTR